MLTTMARDPGIRDGDDERNGDTLVERRTKQQPKTK